LKNTITSFKFSFVLLLLLLSGKVEGHNINLQIQIGDVTCFGGSNGVLNEEVINSNNCGPKTYKCTNYNFRSSTTLLINEQYQLQSGLEIIYIIKIL